MSVTVPLPPKPKARPRVTTKGTYMPSDYSEWRQAVSMLLRRGIRDRFDGPVEVQLVFYKDSFEVTVEASERPRHGRSDIDNLAGAVLEALQDSGVIADDRQVTVLDARFG